MQAYRIETTLGKDGELNLRQLPFQEGAAVEVIVLAHSRPRTAKDRYPLRGLPFRYDRPTDPVAEDDWEILG